MVTFELSNGKVVYLKEAWDCDAAMDVVCVYDFVTDEYIGDYYGTLPDEDDLTEEELERLVDEVEQQINMLYEFNFCNSVKL